MTPNSRNTEHTFKFYGRLKGVRLSKRQAGLVENLLPQLRLDIDAPEIDPQKPVWLEIGFGGGEHLAWQAHNNTDVNFIGAEPFVNGVAKLLVKITELDLTNIRILDGDARVLLQKLPDACLDRIFLLFPDPWPKSRHHKRRFVNQNTLGDFARILKPQGEFRFVSDIDDYVDWTLQEVRKNGRFKLSQGDKKIPPPDWCTTRYQQKAIREGRETTYLSFTCE